MPLGPRALLDIAVPVGVDASEVFRLQMEGGLTVEDVLTLTTTVIGEANVQLAQRYGGLISFTQSNYARYRQGGATRSMTQVGAEYSAADPSRSDQIGHMLPRRDFKDSLAWTAAFLRRADRELLRFDALDVRDRWVNRVDYDCMTRLLSKAENQIGSAGWDVPWVNGTAGNVDFVPPQWRGNSFASSHTHFIRVNAAISTTNTVTTLDTMAQHLAEHGHVGRKIALVSQADLAKYTGITDKKFVGLIPGEFRLASGSTSSAYTALATGELQGIPGELFGYFSSDYGIVELRYHERIPTGYLWMGKSYGDNQSGNPLAIRLDKGGDFGLMIKPTVSNHLKPELQGIEFVGTHGIGVNDRTNGVAAQIATGGTSYDEPTIS